MEEAWGGGSAHCMEQRALLGTSDKRDWVSQLAFPSAAPSQGPDCPGDTLLFSIFYISGYFRVSVGDPVTRPH